MIFIEYFSNEIAGLPIDSITETLPVLVSLESRELGDITLIFCTDEELLAINKEHLDHDYYTDIITFNYNNDSIISGDLFISVDRIKDNATQLAVSMEEELHRVCYHGVLHLVGYNDKTDQEIELMRAKENFYLNKLFHVKH
ncbi:MAG: rRNA maturation RNase YbeY [Flavobacteriales bacterium]|jgi:probable rRNA maturation factor